MSVVVGIAEVFAGHPSPALANAIVASQAFDARLVAVLHRPQDLYEMSAVDDEIDRLADFLDTQDCAYSIETSTGDASFAGLLCEQARSRQARVIVVDLAAQPSMAKHILGDQAQQLLLEAPCSILVARERTSAPA